MQMINNIELKGLQQHQNSNQKLRHIPQHSHDPLSNNNFIQYQMLNHNNQNVQTGPSMHTISENRGEATRTLGRSFLSESKKSTILQANTMDQSMLSPRNQMYQQTTGAKNSIIDHVGSKTIMGDGKF